MPGIARIDANDRDPSVVPMFNAVLLIFPEGIAHVHFSVALTDQVPGIAHIDANDLDPAVLPMFNAVLLIFPEGIAPVHFSVALTRCRASPASMPMIWTPLWWRA